MPDRELWNHTLKSNESEHSDLSPLGGCAAARGWPPHSSSGGRWRRCHLSARGPRQAQQRQQLPFQGGHLRVTKTVLRAVRSPAGQGEGPPRSHGPQNPLPFPASYGQKDTKEWENQHLGEGREGRGGCGQQSLSTARAPRAERSRPAGLWRASGGNPHLDPPSVLSKRQCSLTTQYVK